MSTFTPLPRRSDFLSNPPVTPIAGLPPTCEENGDCGICWMPLTDDCRPVLLHGTHVFCQECIVPWLEQYGQCPYCRQDVFSDIPPGIEKLQWSVNKYLSYEIDNIEDRLIFDEDVLRAMISLHKQSRQLGATIEKLHKAPIISPLLIEYYTQQQSLKDCSTALNRWRAKMYTHLPGNIIWSTFNFPRNEACLNLRSNTHTYLRINSRQSIMTMQAALQADDKRYQLLELRSPDFLEPRQQPMHHHSMLCLLFETIIGAVQELEGTRQSATRFHAALKQRVDELLNVVMERALRGEQEAIAMKRFAGTLVTKVVEAQTRCKI
nr:hypothetical protein B0A51_02528 [Rachicladosporium sp. CCFEE 5018]OQO32474.1 hypothetical protein B0A51_00263 [Rachicladosporium sp. CCFEE 5018]